MVQQGTRTLQWFVDVFCEGMPVHPSVENPWGFVTTLSLYDPFTTVWCMKPGYFDPDTREINGVTHAILGGEEYSGVVDPKRARGFLERFLY